MQVSEVAARIGALSRSSEPDRVELTRLRSLLALNRLEKALRANVPVLTAADRAVLVASLVTYE